MTLHVTKRLRGTALWALALSSQLVLSAAAYAEPGCNGRGWLCIRDNSTGKHGNFEGNNASWAKYGWANKADWFRNDGTQMAVCVYPLANCKATSTNPSMKIPLGYTWVSYNFGQSNRWTTAKACPTSCS